MRVFLGAGTVEGGCARVRLRVRLLGSPGSDCVRRTRLTVGATGSGSAALAGRFLAASGLLRGCSSL